MSTYAKGLSYELLTIAVLRSYSFNIEHCGKVSDKGKDFWGHWVLPNKQVPLVGQCKYHNVRSTPSYVREMEAVVARYRIQNPPILGMVVSQSGFTLGSIRACLSSQLPIILCSIQPNRSVKSCHTEVLSNSPLPDVPVDTSPPNIAENYESLEGYISYFLMNSIVQDIIPSIRIVNCLKGNQSRINLYYINNSTIKT